MIVSGQYEYLLNSIDKLVTDVIETSKQVSYNCKHLIFYICEMNSMNFQKLREWYASNFEANLKGRRILFDDIQPLIEKLPNIFQKEIIGFSENKIPIFKISIGSGKTKVLGWSQMHGNECTGTKALFDLFQFFLNPTSDFQEISEKIL